MCLRAQVVRPLKWHGALMGRITVGPATASSAIRSRQQRKGLRGRPPEPSASGRPDSNRRPSAWEADALPTELRPRTSKSIQGRAALSRLPGPDPVLQPTQEAARPPGVFGLADHLVRVTGDELGGLERALKTPPDPQRPGVGPGCRWFRSLGRSRHRNGSGASRCSPGSAGVVLQLAGDLGAPAWHSVQHDVLDLVSDGLVFPESRRWPPQSCSSSE